MSVLQRVLMALALMAAAAAAIRLSGNRSSPRVVGGWRRLGAPAYR